MSTFFTHHALPLTPHGVRKVGDLLRFAEKAAATILALPARWYANRQLGHTMGSMSDHELSDIGLTRQDVADLTALPMSSEAGAFLATRARHPTPRR